jgi:site-specific recombinase XerD
MSGASREHVESFLEDLLTRRSAATANNRYRGLVAFFTWLQEEGEIPSSPMARMKPPAIPQQPVPVPSTADIQTILKGGRTTWAITSKPGVRSLESAGGCTHAGPAPSR